MAALEIDITGIGAGKPAEAHAAEAERANRMLHDGTGAGSEWLGWISLPSSIGEAELKAVEDAARDLRGKTDLVIVLGIGGSYLGAKAVIDALSPYFAQPGGLGEPDVVFAGQNLSEDYLYELTQLTDRRSVAVIVVSKSGTTTETAIAFRLLREQMEKRYGRPEAASRIIAITDASRGALKTLADKEGYRTFVIPDDIGGRYSVLTPVGLLPLACAGIDIRRFADGAREMERLTAAGVPFGKNPAAQYAAARDMLYRAGHKIEIFVAYEPRLLYIGEWWKELFGESEGKEGKGIFPASMIYTTDLHSMGQYVQEGERTLFETVVSVAEPKHTLAVGRDPEDLDGLNYLAGKRVGEICHLAEQGVKAAHMDGGVPNIKVVMPEIDEYWLGSLLYFFEKACAISGYMLGVNPFDQPGVEAYKRNMFRLLGKPGYGER